MNSLEKMEIYKAAVQATIPLPNEDGIEGIKKEK